MEYLLFIVWFTIIHTACYIVAGVTALYISADLYRDKQRHLDYLRDMNDPAERDHVTKWMFPAQLLRGVLLAIVLLPILGALGDLSFGVRFAFLFGLLFLYTDFAGAVPFSNNIEGFVYMKQGYLKKRSFWKLYLETFLYSLLFASVAGFFLF